MNSFDTICGAWIFPDFHIVYTAQHSHIKSLSALGIVDEIAQCSSKFHWTKLQMKHHYDTDVAYIALRIGYVRVTCYGQDVGVQAYHNMHNLDYQMLAAIIECIQNICSVTTHIVYESLATNEYTEFCSIHELRHALCI